MNDALLPFMTGLSSGFSHCIGMCGIFVLSTAAVSRAAESQRNYVAAVGRQALFHGGRLVSLSILGLFAGLLGSLASFRGHMPAVQAWVSIVAGITLVLLALGQLGIAPKLRVPEPDVLGSGGGKGRKLYVDALRSKHWLQPLALGTLIGFLPCGLTYSVLIYALGLPSVPKSVVAMLFFGIGTIPGLLTLGLFAEAVPGLVGSQAVRAGITRLSGIILLIMAWFLVSRGWDTLRGL
jgi:sulfite exporter TauE/SafE